ncbi:MAG: hypothetical protein H7839_23580 [Magnetococcus sp. YQC-5]
MGIEAKEFRIDFFKGVVGRGRELQTVENLLATMSQSATCPAHKIDAFSYGIRDLQCFANGRSFKGIFCKYRHDEIPHIGAHGKPEHDILLDEDEGLIEKNHFLFIGKSKTLVYQANGHGSRATRMALYLTKYRNLDNGVYFEPILNNGHARELLEGNGLPKTLTVSFARPEDPAFDTGIAFTQAAIDSLKHSGGHRMKITITPERGGRLTRSVKESLLQLVSSGVEVSAAKIEIEQDDGSFYPVDLIAQRLFARKKVTVIGKYPDPNEMFSALNNAYEEHAPFLEVF